MLDKVAETPGFNALVKGRHGYVLYNKNDTYVGRSIENYGEFCEGEVELFRQICKEGDVVVEVGANIGTHTLALSKLVGAKGRIHAFEPQRIVFQTLCANMALNSVENVDCYHAGAGAEDGFVPIPDIRYDVPGNFGGLNARQFKAGRKVRMVRLDGFVEVSRLKLLKVDVEGMEQEVLRGARELIARFKPVLYLENNPGEHSRNLIELIWSLEYRLFWHLPPLFNPENFARNPENLFPGTVSVNMVGFPKSAELNLTGFAEVVDSASHPLDRKPGPGPVA